MDIFLENLLPVSLLLLVSLGAWLFTFIFAKVKKQSLPSALKLLLCAVSVAANLTLAFFTLVWGCGLEHITAVFLLSLLLVLH
jgi:hypothetical protein